jgi:hypothetical protein
MILSKSVFVKMNSKHIRKYIEKGYLCKPGDILEIKVEDLLTESHSKVKVKCDVCEYEKEIKYQVYLRKKLQKLIIYVLQKEE